MIAAQEHHPRVLAVVSKDSYQKALQDYHDLAHHEILRRKNRENIPFIYGLCGPVGEEKGKKVLLPLESIPLPLEAILQNAELKYESSRPWNAPSEDELSWVPGAEATEWSVYDFKVAHYQTSASDFVRDVLGINLEQEGKLWPDKPEQLALYRRFWPISPLLSAGILYEKSRPKNKIVIGEPLLALVKDPRFERLYQELEEARLVVGDVAYDEQLGKCRPKEVSLIYHPEESSSSDLLRRIRTASSKSSSRYNPETQTIGFTFTVDSAQVLELKYEGNEQKRYFQIDLSNRIDEYGVTENNVDLVVIAFLDEHKWHQEPLFEHTEGEGWRASGGGGSCWR